jgi:hypothetical protein
MGLEDIWEGATDEARRRWYAARNQAVADAQNAYERGRQIYANAIRTGQDVVARTPHEVRALGSAANAGVRSFSNAATFGVADKLEAATSALFGAGGPGDFGQRYDNELAQQYALNQQGLHDHPIASKTGEVAGAIGGILAADSPLVAGAAARLIPGGAKAFKAIQGAKRVGFIPEGLGTMAAVTGGTVGGAVQLGTDVVQGKPTSLQDFLSAAGGGALGTERAMRWGPVLGAAVGGGATEALRGDPDGILSAATTSAYGGRALGTLGEQISSGLPSSLKGYLGEGLTFAKSWARGEPIPFESTDSAAVAQNFPKNRKAGPQQAIPLSKSYTQADWLTDWGRALEAKFGVSAGLTPAQTRAVSELGQFYLPDHWLPSDIGDLSGGWLGSTAGQSPPDDSQPQ